WVSTKKRSHSITTDIYFGLGVEEILGIYQKAIALHNQEISTVGWELRKFWVFTKKRSHSITRRYLLLVGS
ncbi:hypothetical protein, partial [Limnospira platensis]|uniref:hypothetical protein n=1 Tax=Limnospira platensis TaxID=118562 RepID=UPI001376E691